MDKLMIGVVVVSLVLLVSLGAVLMVHLALTEPHLLLANVVVLPVIGALAWIKWRGL